MQKQKQLALCYKLFNKAQIEWAQNGKIHIKSNDLSSSDKANIKSAAKGWMQDIKMEFKNLQDSKQAQSLKDKLLAKTSDSDDFKLIQKYFPSSKIKEVVFNNNR